MKKIKKCLQAVSVVGMGFTNVFASQEHIPITRRVNDSVVKHITWSSVSTIICYLAIGIIIASCVGYIIASAQNKQKIKKMVGTSLIVSVLVLETSVVSNMIRSAKHELGLLEYVIEDTESKSEVETFETLSEDENLK